jgi:hypothetical protein
MDDTIGEWRRKGETLVRGQMARTLDGLDG